MVTADGYPIGTFCLFDKKSRTFSEAEKQLLLSFATLAMQAIEARHKAMHNNEALETAVAQRTEALQAKIEQLQQSNTQLERFAYVTAHDMQGPIRKIQTLADLLFTRYSSQLGTEGVSFLTMLNNAAVKMSALVKNTLQQAIIHKEETK